KPGFPNSGVRPSASEIVADAPVVEHTRVRNRPRAQKAARAPQTCRVRRARLPRHDQDRVRTGREGLMLANFRFAGASLCLLLIAACAASAQTARQEADENTAASVRTDDGYLPPMPPPPPPMSAPAYETARAFSGAVYAQTAPQPMPGDVDRDNYEDVDPNPIHIVAEDPVSTFSIDVDTASYSNVRSMLNAGRLPPSDAVRI